MQMNGKTITVANGRRRFLRLLAASPLLGLYGMSFASSGNVQRELKKASSVWVHDEIGVKAFAWQEGYAAFTVSATARDAVQRYIANQEVHHQAKSFREELVESLDKAGVEYDPKYLD